jgi:excisionase family DNA binding protein
MEQYLTVSTLSERTQTSESFWRKAIARRALPVVRIGGARIVRIKIADAERFLEASPARPEVPR